MILNRRAQSLVEYVTLIVVVLGVFVAIQSYVKRGVQGRWKQAVDEMGDQYDPRVAVSNVVHRIETSTNTDIYSIEDQDGQWTRRVDDAQSVETKTGYHTVGAY